MNTKRRRHTGWDKRRGQGLANGLPGRLPSREARHLARTLPHDALPPALWHASAEHSAALTSGALTCRTAIHEGSGGTFLVASLDDGAICAIATQDSTSRALATAFWDDPTGWARRQSWRFGAHVEGVAP